ncbi:MAG: transcriptional repressor, partial [Gammaproteobacteria bacterium]|nr:transcriptional repressor [Gammaproteobacteria bacterium]
MADLTNFPLTGQALAAHLAAHGVTPTSQRLEIAEVLFRRPQHLSAEQILAAVNRQQPLVSKATVYNTLKLFSEKGLVREVIADPARIFYDSTAGSHH